MANKEFKTVIKVGMNTNEVKTSVTDLNKQMKVLDSDFRKYNEQLKSVGTESEKLALKKDYLTQKIQLQQQKVEKLREQFQKNNEKYGENSKQVQENIIKLNSAETVLAKLENQLGETTAEIVKQTDKNAQLSKSLEEVSKKSKDAGEKMSKAGSSLMKLSAPILLLGVSSGKMAMDFEDSMAKVSTISDETIVSNEELSNSVLELSSNYAKGADEMSDALYETMSAGVGTADSIKFLDDASKLARAGFTDTGTSVDTLTSSINAYGLEAKDATKISDQLLIMQNYGKITVGEFGDSIGRVAPLAAQTNVSTQELFSSIAVLTKNGIQANESVSGMKAILSGIIKPTSEASEEAKRLGLSFNASALESKGLAGFLGDVMKKTHGNTETMAKLFGSVEALNAMMVLTSEKGSTDFAESLNLMSNSAGATQEAFDKMNTTSFSAQQTLQSVKNGLIEAGKAMLPILDILLKLVTPVINLITFLAEHNPALLQTVTIVSMMAFTIGGMLKMFGGVAGGISNITSVLGGGMNPTMLKTVGIIAAVVAGLTGLLVLITALTGKKDDVGAIAGSITGAVNGAQSSIQAPDVKKQIPGYATVNGSHRSGLSRVPFDGYVAELHEGEEVLTASDPRNRNNKDKSGSGGDTYYVTIDAKNIKDFNDVVNVFSNIKSTSRMGVQNNG